MEDVTNFFQEVHEVFTVYVVEQRFVIGRGNNYFKSYVGKENYISSNVQIKKRMHKILEYTQKKVPPIAELIQMLFLKSGKLNITDSVTILAKLFNTHEHQAAGPEVVDPIIIQEGQVLREHLTQIITFHRKSILQPRIIILLKDNDFKRAKQLLADCPDGINVKMIRNSGECEIYKIINRGTDSIEKFIDSYSRQCFSTCSNTPRDVIYNNQWAEDSKIKFYSPMMFKIRSKLINDEKFDARSDIQLLINALEAEEVTRGDERILINSFLCMAKLFKIFCYDIGGQDMHDAKLLANELDNELLQAHVYRFSHFLTNSRTEKQALLMQANKIFSNNNIEDHAIYCLNNSLIHQFSMEHINLRDFRKMQETAVSNVPGLVGMSHILNNVGVAYLLTGNAEDATTCLTKGLDYAKERPTQKMAIISNRLMAKSYGLMLSDDIEISMSMKQLFDSLGHTSLPFNVSHFAMNILSVAYGYNANLGNYLVSQYPIKKMVQLGLDTNIMGSGSIIQQMIVMAAKYPSFSLLNELHLPDVRTPISGIRLDFIDRYAFNPFFHNVWL